MTYGSCVNCKFHVLTYTNYWGQPTPIDMCSRRSTNFVHPVSGEKIERTELWPCVYEREKASWWCSILMNRCGPDGACFERKQKEIEA